MDAAADVRTRAPGRPVDRVVRARVGRSRLRPGREVRAARQAGPADPLAGRRRARRQHRRGVQERPLRMEPGHGPRRMGRVRAHARDGDARGRPSRLVASLVCGAGRRRGARPLRVRRRHAGRDSRALHRAHRPRAAGAAVGARALGVARVLRDTRGGVRGGRDAARAEDPVRRADARRPRRVEGGDAIRFRMGRGTLPRSLRSAGADQGAPAARLRLGISVRLDPLAAVRGARRSALPAQAPGRRPLRLRLGHVARDEPLRQRADAAARRAGSSTSRTRRRTRGGATRTRSSSRRAST